VPSNMMYTTETIGALQKRGYANDNHSASIDYQARSPINGGSGERQGISETEARRIESRV
jgi:hypothetical protein